MADESNDKWGLIKAILPPGLSLVGDVFENIFGRKQQQGAGYEMSPYEKMVVDMLMKRLQSQTVPSWVTEPYYQQAQNIKEKYGRQVGAQGVEDVELRREAYQPMSEASTNYLQNQEERLLSAIGGLTRGTGTRTAWSQTPIDFTKGGKDLGALLWELLNRKKNNSAEDSSKPSGGGFQYGWGGF